MTRAYGNVELVKLNIEIDDGITAPETRKKIINFPFSILSVGQSFGVELKHHERLSRAATDYNKKHNTRLMVRKGKHPKTGVDESRCHRV
jgi:hypothetical protein